MLITPISFQEKATIDLRRKLASATRNYIEDGEPQVISFTAPTGSGKTIIMTQLMEDVFFGMSRYDQTHKKTVQFAEQPEAIFVWLSDSPALNLQSKEKIDAKSDKIKLNQCVVIEDESFNLEILEDGKIYFLNTQKLGAKGKLTSTSDKRHFTIWDTLRNTAREKADHFYFIIDEAHRGSLGVEGGTATTIMQKFIKGSQNNVLPPMPVVIGMSATIKRFEKLVEGSSSTQHKVVVSPEDVRSSGLLKDHIIVTHPENISGKNDDAILEAATKEWMDKCVHWNQYCVTQHEANVNPIYVIQVQDSKDGAVSATNLDDCLAKIEETTNYVFKEHEVVHAFGSKEDIQVNGLTVHHVDANDIADDRRIKIVFFKESLSTGWDCPRAETMMSYRHSQDYTTIAQLLGRIIRTPLQRRIKVDASLNDVHIYLPYYNSEAVKAVIEDLQSVEGGSMPDVQIDDDPFETPFIERLTARPVRKPPAVSSGGNTAQISMFDTPEGAFAAVMAGESEGKEVVTIPVTTKDDDTPIPKTEPKIEYPAIGTSPVPSGENITLYEGEQLTFKNEPDAIDRVGVIEFINKEALLNFEIRDVETRDFLSSLIDLCELLSREGISQEPKALFKEDVCNMITAYISEVKASNTYNTLIDNALKFKLESDIFDAFGKEVTDYKVYDVFTSSSEDLDRQFRSAGRMIGGIGIENDYLNKHFGEDDIESLKGHVVIFAAAEQCIVKLNKYAKEQFQKYCDEYRVAMVHKSESCNQQYDKIVTSASPISEHNFRIPTDIDRAIDKDGKEYDNHLLVNRETGKIKISLDSSWEYKLIEEDSSEPDFVTWLRNKRCSWALRIPYKYKGKDKAMYPDFLLVRKHPAAGYVIDIEEPHNPNLDDNLPKAKALAEYARRNPKLGRVELIRMKKDITGKERLVRLDFCRSEIRDTVASITTSEELDHLFETHGTIREGADR